MRSMRIGRLLTLPDTLDIDSLRAQAADAAARGLDSVWTNQAPGSWDPPGILGPFRREGPAELGTAIVATYPRHPVTMAAEALTVQSATGGRLTLGIGPSQTGAACPARPRPSSRGQRRRSSGNSSASATPAPRT
jgi:5,10-methylenetetrahydromethanopterin reductase